MCPGICVSSRPLITSLQNQSYVLGAAAQVGGTAAEALVGCSPLVARQLAPQLALGPLLLLGWYIVVGKTLHGQGQANNLHGVEYVKAGMWCGLECCACQGAEIKFNKQWADGGCLVWGLFYIPG